MIKIRGSGRKSVGCGYKREAQGDLCGDRIVLYLDWVLVTQIYVSNKMA